MVNECTAERDGSVLEIFEDAIGFFYCLECADKDDPMIGAMYVPERENVLKALEELKGDIRCNWCGENLEDGAVEYLNRTEGGADCDC